MPASRTLVFLVSALVAASLCGATRALSRDRPGDFDFYVLALSIAPSFCALTGTQKHKAQCRDPSDADYRAIPLTIHGLWPNKRNRRAREQPQGCSTEPLPTFSAALARDLETYMPGVADGLAQYEWDKHGVCSGLAPEAYFEKLVALARAANTTIGAAMKDKEFFGKPMAVGQLLDAVAANNPDLANALQVDCRFSRKGPDGAPPRAYVAEIRVLIAKDLAGASSSARWPADFVPRSTAGWGANSGCPQGVGFLPGGFGE